MMPKLYNKNNEDFPPDAVYIGRGSPYGNPFKIGPDGNRDAVCAAYSNMIENQPALKEKFIQELKGKDLVCHCVPNRCHGHYLIRIANETIDFTTSRSNAACPMCENTDFFECQIEKKKEGFGIWIVCGRCGYYPARGMEIERKSWVWEQLGEKICSRALDTTWNGVLK